MAKPSILPRCSIETMLIKRVTSEDCYELRESILRPGQPKENWTFVEDNNLRTIHLAVEQEGEIIAIVSLLPEANPDCPNHPWRLRGMAVKEDLRGQGVGQLLLEELVAMVEEGVWCTARKNVQAFYAKNGFEIFGDEFTMNEMPHVRMRTS